VAPLPVDHTMTPPTPRPRTTLTSLADRLRQGPLQSMLALHDKATALAAERELELDDTRLLEQLAELVRLTQLTMDRFQTFTIELKVLVFELGQARHSN
jgi:hypothetical protein